jgi:hypothetical protein
MSRLDDHAADVYSQFGEDGCIAHIFEHIGVKHQTCVEFGAADGISCSNTAHLWRDQGWKAMLVEPDHARYEQLEGNAGPFDTICRRALVTPSGPMSISSLLAEHRITGVDYMSIDIDGDDYFILAELEVRPRLISVEFNPTIPPHLRVSPGSVGQSMGSSARALVELGEERGYRFVGATYCNVFLVDASEPYPAPLRHEVDLEVLFEPYRYTYAVTDFAGRVTLLGQPMPWQPTVPYVEPLGTDAVMTHVTTNPQEIRRGFESKWGPALWLPAEAVNPETFGRYLAGAPQLVCVDITQIGDRLHGEDYVWLWELARDARYQARIAGPVLALVGPR